MRSPIIFRVFKDNQLVGVRQFDQDQIVIGQNADVHLDLHGEGVAPIHCLIELRDGGHFVCDLGSQSGTFKNGQAVLDEAIASGDEIGVGPYKLSFFVGVPKPNTIPTGTMAGVAAAPPVQQAAPVPPPTAPVVEKKETPSIPATAPVFHEEKKPEVAPAAKPAPTPTPVTEVKTATPSIPVEAPKVEDRSTTGSAPAKPEIKTQASSFKKKKKKSSYAPASEIRDLRSYLQPGNGPVVEVIVAWRERIITTHHYKGSANVRVNSGEKVDLPLPDGLAPKGFPLLDMAGGGLRVNTTSDMAFELISAQGQLGVDDLTKAGKAQKAGLGYSVKVDQSEMLCLTLPQGNLVLYIRFGPPAPVVPLMPPFMLSSSEATGVLISLILVGLLALYISATIPKDWEEQKQEEVQRIAQIVFNKPPPPKPPAPEPEPKEVPPPTPPKVVPPPPPKKVVVSEKTAPKKGPQVPSQKKSVAARASEVAPKPNSQKRPKKFTSTRQGGAIKTGNTEGANAQSSNRDMSKVGLFSAFGGGGSRAKIDKAYSGAGEVLGMADRATGTSGSNQDRAGEDLGSRFKDSGAGGKGTATQGIAGIGTKGRGSGQSAYGAADGYGSKTSVSIEGGGMGESFDGTIDKDAIRRVIRANKHELQSCYERALNTLAKGKRLEGKIVLSWEIVARGQARNVKVTSSTLGNRQVENCIRDRLANWTFPEPPQGLVAEVQAYPFVLNQSN